MSQQASVFVPASLWTVNGERKMHHMERARRVREVREEAYYAAMSPERCPVFAGAVIHAHPVQGPRGKLADVAGHLPVVKAAIDGLVDALVLPDDGPVVVTALVFHPPERGPVEGVRLTLVGAPG